MKKSIKIIKILGIETSCDETAAAVVEINNNKISILSNIVSSQVDLHKKYGGVYPELASRAHLENILPAIKAALEKANSKLENIDLIAVTAGPGLVGSLLIGVETAKALSYANGKPIIGINHWLGHIYSNFVEQSPPFPILNLIVSGGHTGLVIMKSHQNIIQIGQTLDDSAGEAFDKVATMLNLSYPGGPAIEKEAEKLKATSYNLKPIRLPRPMLNSGDFNFSFSGLKTAVLYLTKKLGKQKTRRLRAQIAAEFQQAVIDILIGKTLQAAKIHKPKSICISGGVSANIELRKQFKQKVKKIIPQSSIFYPPNLLCTDNAAMMAIAATFQDSRKYSNWSKIQTDPNLKL